MRLRMIGTFLLACAPGPLFAQPAHFIKAVQGLVARGSLTTSQAQPLLDGAAAILEQIEGNDPKKTLADEGDPGILD